MEQTKIVVPRLDLQIRKSYLIEIPLDDGTTAPGVNSKPSFQRDNLLNPESTGSVIFTGWESEIVDYLAVAPSGRPVISATDATKLAITLMWQDKEFIKLQPYTGIISAISFGMIRRLDNVQINLTKSYITVLASGITAGKSAVINFYYRDFNPAVDGKARKK